MIYELVKQIKNDVTISSQVSSSSEVMMSQYSCTKSKR